MLNNLRIHKSWDIITDITEIVKRIDALVDTENWQGWTPDRIATLGKRSTEQILAEGDILYLAPCQDLSILAYDAVRLNEIDNNPVFKIEELYDARPNRERKRLHFHIGINREGKKYILDFKGQNEVLFYEGIYKNPTEGATTNNIHAINNFNPTKTVDLTTYQKLLNDFDIKKEFTKLNTLNNEHIYNFYKEEEMKDKPEKMTLISDPAIINKMFYNR